MTDRLVVLLVVVFLGLVGIATIVAATTIVLHSGADEVPEALWTLAGAALGALGALLARTSSSPPVDHVEEHSG